MLVINLIADILTLLLGDHSLGDPSPGAGAIPAVPGQGVFGLSAKRESFIIFVFYTILIVGTFAWSGRGADLTVYDRVVTEWGGIALPVRDLAQSERFYRHFLDLPPMVPAGHTFLQRQVSCFGLPAKRPLCLQAHQGPGGFSPAEVVVNVKSGFPNLYSVLKQRSLELNQPGPAGAEQPVSAAEDQSKVQLSKIALDGDQEYFTAVDPDGNRIVFRRTKWFKLPNRVR